MFGHNYKYILKTLFKNKSLIFWTFAFPIILGTFFFLAFSDIENSEKLQIIDIAIVNNENYLNDEVLTETFTKLSEKDDNQVFNIEYTSEAKAKKLLADDNITGYLIVLDDLKVVIKQNGINATVFKYIVEEIVVAKQLVNDIVDKEISKEITNGNYNLDYEYLYNNIIEKVNNEKANLKDISSSNLSYITIEYYTLIAMSCLYGAMLGMYAINNSLANMSTKGMRVSVSPLKKTKLLLSSILASYTTQLIGLALLFLFTIFVIKVDYGDNIGLILLLSIIGSLSGLSFGVMIGTVFKTSENAKIGIIIAFTMLGSFLSGMMGVSMKYIIDKNVPLVNQLNPANMITDGFYGLYYYTSLNRYFINILSLILFIIITIFVSVLVLRRQKYDSL